MKDPVIFIAAIALIMPFAVLIVAANMRRSHERYLRKIKQRTEEKTKTRIK